MKVEFEDIVITMPDHAPQLWSFMKLAEDAKLSDKEKEICLSRLDAANDYFMNLDLKSEEGTPEEEERFEKVAQPLVNDDGETVECTEYHLAWMLDQIMLRDLFPNRIKLEKAKEEVHKYFRDDKPFTTHRWFQMQKDQLRAVDTARRKGLS